VVLVARAGLGTINQTLLSLEAIEKRGLRVSAVILNPGPNAVDLPLFRQNREYLARHTRFRVFLWEDTLANDIVRAVQEAGKSPFAL
jgi:dethiobiotin synthetase